MQRRSGLTDQQGFKTTDLGEIPEDWRVLRLERVCTEIGDGIHTTPLYADDGDYYFVNGNNIGDGRISLKPTTKRVDELEFRRHKKPLSARTILMSINGTIGSLGLYEGEPIVLGKSAAYLNVSEEYSRLFVYFCLQTEQTTRQFADSLTGSTIKNLGLGGIRSTLIAVPPTREEQERISDALADVDAGIKAIEELIVKVEALRTGLMQELVLHCPPSAKERWRAETLASVATISKGQPIGSAQLSSVGSYSYLNGGVAPSGYTDVCNTGANSIAISEGGNSCGYVQFMQEPFWCGGHCYNVVSEKIDSKFLYFALKAREGAIMALRVGSGLPNVQKTALSRLSIEYPDDPRKQVEIASTLSIVDDELHELVRKADKLSLIKAGMVQELLTGRVRLV